MFRVLAAVALATCVGACGAYGGGLPRCPSDQRVAPNEDYSNLATSMVARYSNKFDGVSRVRSETDRTERLANYAKMRNEWLPTINDACLRAHAEYVVGIAEDMVRESGTERDRSYEARQRREEAAKDALAAKLGVQR